MKTKTFGIFAMLFLAVFAVMTGVFASAQDLPIAVSEVKINGDSLQTYGWNDLRTVFERDSDLEVKVTIERTCQVVNDPSCSETINDVQIEAEISGTKDDVSEETDPFDVQANSVYTKTLKLKISPRVEDQEYQLRIRVNAPNTDESEMTYSLLVEAPQNSIAVKDLIMSPSDKVLAGRAFTASARIKNYGQADEEDVKVVFEMPELRIMETDYINLIEKDETESSDEMLLRIPADTKTGSYKLDVTVYYNDLDDKVESTYTVNVVADNQAANVEQTQSGLPAGDGRTTITVGMQAQTLARGENGVIYPITLTNGADTAKTYTLSVSGLDQWATTKLSPSNVLILNPRESKQAYVYVAANEAATVGEHVFSLQVNVGDDVVQQIPLKADVLESAGSSAWDGVKTALQVGVVMLVVLIVILAVVMLYQRKSKGSAKEDEQIAQTYY